MSSIFSVTLITQDLCQLFSQTKDQTVWVSAGTEQSVSESTRMVIQKGEICGTEQGASEKEGSLSPLVLLGYCSNSLWDVGGGQRKVELWPLK